MFLSTSQSLNLAAVVTQPDLASTIISCNGDNIKIGEPIRNGKTEALIGSEKMDELLEYIVEQYNKINKDAE